MTKADDMPGAPGKRRFVSATFCQVSVHAKPAARIDRQLGGPYNAGGFNGNRRRC
jgi:hypothetical protein